MAKVVINFIYIFKFVTNYRAVNLKFRDKLNIRFLW